MERICPFSETSPIKQQSSRGLRIIPIALTIAVKIARSCTEPLFLVSAGARFIITEAVGNSRLQALSAERMRSRLSLTTISGSPTISN